MVIFSPVMLVISKIFDCPIKSFQTLNLPTPEFENINVVSWIVLAIKNVIVIGIVYVCVVLIFYRKKIRDLLKNMKK